ncbi:MAG: hypothetical protein ABEI78_00740 [Candidatus Nanohaloarchaea archaeon]
MNLLKITEEDIEEFDELFEATEHFSLEEIAPEVLDGNIDIKIKKETVKKFDASFLQIPVGNASFGRVLLEIMEENNIKTNYPSTAFYLMAKKNYLYYVLEEKNINIPKTAVIPSNKAIRNLEEEIYLPMIGRKFEGPEETQIRLLEEKGELEEFSEGTQDREKYMVFHQNSSGEKYRCLVAGDNVITLQDITDGWKIKNKNLQYSNLSKNVKKTVKKASNVIGAPVAEVLVKGEKIIDIKPNPDLDLYQEISGKNPYEAVAEALKGDT